MSRTGRGGQTRSRFNNRPNSRNNQSRKPKKDYIHPSRFIQKAMPQEEEAYVACNQFANFDMAELLKKNLASMGYVSPSPIQDESIPHSLAGKDIVGIANTGTGKTAAFAIPVLNKLMANPRSKAIILAPTRELAEQIEQQCRTIGKNSGLFGALLIGGTPMRPQINDLRYNPRIIIGTPGRVKDHLERGSLDISDCDIVVLDEVDRMLDMGFVHDITQIINMTLPDRQNLYFSATLDERVKKIIDGFSKNPVKISVKSGDTSLNVNQDIVQFRQDDKFDILHDLLASDVTEKTIIFDDTQRTVERLAKDLASKGFASASIHGGKSQAQRQRVLKQFKNSQINILVATDVAARGIDVADITHVINYSQPQCYSDYIHRIGRTGRAGKVGHALTFVPQQ